MQAMMQSKIKLQIKQMMPVMTASEDCNVWEELRAMHALAFLDPRLYFFPLARATATSFSAA
jgi:hypothetical protein